MALLLYLPALQAQLVTVLPPAKFNSTPPAADQTHKQTASTACNPALVGQGPSTEILAGNTYCQHGGTDSAANGNAIWGKTTSNPTGALDMCRKDIAGTGRGVPTNGCVIVLDPEPIQYWTPVGNAPDHLYANATNCIRNWWSSGNVSCHGWMPPTFQANPAAPQFIYFISGQYAAVPPVGTRVNPSDVLPGDGYSHPLNLQPNINPKTQMALITTPKDLNGGGTLFFGDGPMNYQFDGVEITSQSIAIPRPNHAPFTASDPPENYGHTSSPLVYTVGEGRTGGRALSISNTGFMKVHQDGVVRTINTGTPWIIVCHMDGPKGPDMMSILITPNVNHTIFCDTIYSHLAQGQTEITWSWNARINGDLDISQPALTAGGTKYSVNSGQCANGPVPAYAPKATSTDSQEPPLGNVCVVDTQFQCDGVSLGQCFKVQFVPAQNATVATCNAAATATTTAALADNVPQCYNDGVHSFFIDTPPATAPAICFGPWPNPAPDGSDCAAHWQGGGAWAAGTERIMTTDGIRVAFDAGLTPQFTIPAGTAGCMDNTLGIACDRSPIDGALMFRDASATGAGAAHNYTVNFAGNNTAWQIPGTGTLAAAVTSNASSITLTATSPKPNPEAYLRIDSEYFLVAGNTNFPTISVNRGRLGTIGQAHAQGATVVVGPRLMNNIFAAIQTTTVTSPTSAALTFTENVNGWFMAQLQMTMWGGTQSPFDTDTRYQNPASEFDNVPKAAIQRIPTPNQPYYGIDFCSLPIGDGSLGAQYSRFTENHLVKGRSYTIRCYLYNGTGTVCPGSSCYTTTNLACNINSPTPCPDSFATPVPGLDFGADMPIDSVNVVNSTTMDITFFVCDGTTLHPGHGQANLCTPQIMADMGAYNGPNFEHTYVHGSGRVVHTGNAGDPGPAGSDCAGDVETTAAANTPGAQWQCTMQGGQTSQQGLQMECHNCSFRDSFMDNIWAIVSGAFGAAETQGLYALVGTGAHEWRNNFLVAGAEITFSGGSGSPQTVSSGSNVCDFYLYHNYYYRPRWWLNRGIGLVGAAGAATDSQMMENKNMREQKGGCRWEYSSNVHEENFYGYVQTYASTNYTTRIVQNQPNMCCMFSNDIYFHDNLFVRVNIDFDFYGHDPACVIGGSGWGTYCGDGIFPPWSAHRAYSYDELYLQNKGSATQSPVSNSWGNIPYQVNTGATIRYVALNHDTFEFQTPLVTQNTTGYLFNANPPDVSCAAGVGPMGRDLRDIWIQNTIFPSGISTAGSSCGPGVWAVWPSTTTPNAQPNTDLSHRFAGNIWTRGFFSNIAGGINTTTNYLEPSAGPLPFMTYASTVPNTYLLDAGVGYFTGNYNPTGNNTGTGVVTGATSKWISPTCNGTAGTGCVTTDNLPSGYIKTALDAATSGVLTGVEGAPVITTFTISGNIKGAASSGISVQLSGSHSGQTFTDANGNYSFTEPTGSYTILPVLAGYTFSPPQISVTITNANSSNNNFTSTKFTGTGWNATHIGPSPLLPGAVSQQPKKKKP